MAVDKRKIAILGAGQIGEALIGGLLSSGWRAHEELSASTRRIAAAAASFRPWASRSRAKPGCGS